MFKNNKNILNILLIAGFLIFACSEKIIAQYKSAQFKHLVFEKGVPHNYIYNIYQDQYGFMWFCSLYGLVKYDGKQYNEFTHDPEDSLSISSDEVISIYESNTKDIWIGTIEGGLNKLDRRTGKFSRFINNPEDSTSISNNTVWSIQKDSNNNLWIGTSNGINIFKCDSAKVCK